MRARAQHTHNGICGFPPGTSNAPEWQFLGLRLVVGRDHGPLEGSEARRLSHLLLQIPNLQNQGYGPELGKAGDPEDLAHQNRCGQEPATVTCTEDSGPSSADPPEKGCVCSPLWFFMAAPTQRNRKSGQSSHRIMYVSVLNSQWEIAQCHRCKSGTSSFCLMSCCNVSNLSKATPRISWLTIIAKET